MILAVLLAWAASALAPAYGDETWQPTRRAVPPPPPPPPLPPPMGQQPLPPRPAMPAPSGGGTLDPALNGPGGDVVPRQDAPRIIRIDFEGNALFAADSLKVLMELKEGALLDAFALDRDMKLLFRFFESVRVTEEAVSGGVVLRFLVSENPLVVEMNVYGAEELSSGEIREMMSTKVGYPLFPYALATDAEDIVEIYRMRGFAYAQIPEPVITKVSEGGRRVDVTVVEGPKVEVDKIIFRGNAHVCRGDLLDAMRTEEEGFLAFLSDAIFRMDTLLEDLVSLKRRVEAAGFLDAEVVLEDLRFSDDKSRVVIVISIVEHQPYTIGSVEVEIERLEPGEPGSPPPADIAFFTEDAIREWSGLRPGAPYCGELEEKGRERILDAYFCRSYIDAVLAPTVRRGRERQNVVDIQIVVGEGAKSRLRRLDFYGNEYTRDKVLRREARIVPGGYVDRREFDRTLTRLRGTGYFERVTMQINDARTADGELMPGWKDVSFEVLEGSTGQLNFGVGLSTDGGIAGSISFTKRNFDIARWPRSFRELKTRRAFTGAGQKLEVFFAIGTQQSQFSVGFTEPRLFGSKLAFTSRVYRRLGLWESYDVGRLGYRLGLSYPLYRHREDKSFLQAGVTWRHENVDVDDVGPRAVPGAFLFEGENELRSLEGRLSFRTVDDLAEPDWTTTTSLSAELAGTFLGGALDYTELSFLHSQDWSLFRDSEGRRHRLSFRVRVGWSKALEDTPEVPLYERFYAGGSTLRGFQFRGVGPMINGNPTGGEWLVNHSVEYQIPVVEETLALVAFLDGGTLGTSIWEDDAWKWRLSAGVGLRILIPAIGNRPLALDFGFPFLYEDDDERTLVSFSLGRDF